MSSSSDANIQNLLDALTYAMQQDEDIEPYIKDSSVPREEVDSLVNVIQSLQTQLVPVEPSAKFCQRTAQRIDGNPSLCCGHESTPDASTSPYCMGDGSYSWLRRHCLSSLDGIRSTHAGHHRGTRDSLGFHTFSDFSQKPLDNF